MDHINTWMHNKHFESNLNKDQTDLLKDDIINNVFGGMKEMLNHLLKSPHALSTEKQHKLYQTFSTKHPNLNMFYDDDINENDSKQPDLYKLPIDCLNHTMSFLDKFDHTTMQTTSRFLSISSRKYSNTSKTANDIINKILSKNKNENLKGIKQLVETYTVDSWYDDRKYYDKYNKAIKRYGQSLTDKFYEIIFSNMLINGDCLKAFIWELKYKPKPILYKYIPDIIKKKTDTNGVFVAAILECFSLNHLSVIMNDDLISAVFNYFCNLSEYDFGENEHDPVMFFTFQEMGRSITTGLVYEIGQTLLCMILRSGYIVYKSKLFQMGLVTVLKTIIANTKDIEQQHQSLYRQLMQNLFFSLFDNISKVDMNAMMDDSLLVEYIQNLVTESIPSSYDITNKGGIERTFFYVLIKNCNHEQRKKILCKVNSNNCHDEKVASIILEIQAAKTADEVQEKLKQIEE
eukprot:504873_1